MIREADGVYLDFSRQNATTDTLQVGRVGAWADGAPWAAGGSSVALKRMPQRGRVEQGMLHGCTGAPARCAATRRPRRRRTPAPQLLLDLAEAAGVPSKLAALFAGQHINSTEDRAVLHPALRAPRGAVLADAGTNVVPEVWAVLDKIAAFSGRWVGRWWAEGAEMRDGVCPGGHSRLDRVGCSGQPAPPLTPAPPRRPQSACAAASGRVRRASPSPMWWPSASAAPPWGLCLCTPH